MSQSEPIVPTSPLERVRQGMTVLDHSDKRLGTVAGVRLGDPQAVTMRGEEPQVDDAGVIAAPATGTGGALGIGIAAPFLGDHPLGPDVPDQLARELLRAGFVEVDGPDLHGPTRYVPGERIAAVSADTVRLGPDPAAFSPPVPPQMGRSTIVEPVLRTYLGPPHEPAQSSMPPLVASAVLAVVGSMVALGWFVWRRRRAQRQPLQRARRAGQQLANAVAERRELTGIVGIAMMLVLLVIQVMIRSRTAEAESVPASSSRSPAR